MNQLKQLCISASILALLLLFPLSVQANDYVSGHQALEVWDIEGQTNLPLWIKIWLLSLMLVFVSGVFFVKRQVEARWLLGGVVLGMIFSKVGISMLGLVPLSGLVALLHLIFWSPALFLLLKNKPFMQGSSRYAIWSGVATACVLFSFIFDIRDTAIYLNHQFG